MKTEIPILEHCWYRFLGFMIRGAALKGRTYAGYIIWTCPKCKVDLPWRAGIKLLGSHRDLGVDDGEPHALAFLIHCPTCGYDNDFKIALDQYGLYGTGVGLED